MRLFKQKNYVKKISYLEQNKKNCGQILMPQFFLNEFLWVVMRTFKEVYAQTVTICNTYVLIIF